MKTALGLRCWAAFALVSVLALPAALSADPVVSNVRALQRAGTKLVDITYDVTATNNLTVSVTVSTNSGLSYDLPGASFSGTGYGAGVTPGTNKPIVWDAGADFDGQYSTVMRVKVTADDGSQQVLPPDPESIASTPSNGVVSLLYDSVAFLFMGTNAIQTGVSAGAIDALRVIVLRGNVLDQDGALLSGVTVTVNNHSELGQTLTRTNGAYDIVVNGGGPVSVNFAKTGYLSIQRTFDLPWQDYVPVDDVVLKTADTNVMVATLPATNAQVVYGSLQTDTNGSRRALVIIPANTRAYVFTQAGATQETSTLTTRLTEFTVGTNGPSAMPGDLGPMVAYTYALELAAEEAQVKIAGRDTLFSTNVYFYVENFLGMPTGIQVPMAYYNDENSAWIPSSDGRVVELAGTNANGLAELIVATNGAPADAATLAAMGFSDDERRLLTAQYGPAMTQTLWRVPIAQFSTHDPNFGSVPESGGTSPDNPKPSTGDVNDPTDEGDYGRLDLENQVFQETIPIAGTPFRLHYSSARVPGFQGQTSITIPLTGATIPAVLQRIHLKISIAGQNYTYYFTPSTNLNYGFTWDGSDIYGRSLVGTMTATIRIGYEYRAFYALPPTFAASFGFPSGTLIPGNIIAPQPSILWQEHRVPLVNTSRSNGLGWWSVSEYHSYDPVGQILHLGNGADRNAQASRVLIISTFAGTGASGDSGNGGAATNALVSSPNAIAVAPNGDVYFSTESAGHRQVRRVAATNGYIYNAAGRASFQLSWYGEGGPATNAIFDSPRGLAAGPDGSLYICVPDNGRVLRVDTNGIIRTVVGNGSGGYSGDGGAATNAGIAPYGIAVAADGTMYIADLYYDRIRRVGPDGIISTLAGNGTAGYSGDGGPATNALLNDPIAVKLGPDGALFVADYSNKRIRRIGPDGIITTVAGNGNAGYSGDGGAATNAQLGYPNDLAVGSDGTIYAAANSRIREITSDGIIRTIAGTGNTTAPAVNNSPATAADINFTFLGLAVALDGSLYASDYGHNMVRRISRNMPGVGISDQLIADEDGNRFYQFDQRGRHQKTYHAWTGAALLEFGYTNGYLSTITDGDGNVTRVVRNAAGTPQKIVSADNQETILTLNANGFLSAVQNPTGEMTQFGYTTNGLLTSVQGAKGALYTYTVAYNSTGQVVSASDPAGGSTSLRRSGVSNGYEVVSTSALGRARTARVEFLPGSDLRRTLVLSDGTTQEQWEVSNGIQTNRYPSGVVERWQEWPDPRFGMQAPVRTGMVVRLSSGLAMTTTVSKTVGLSNQSWASVAYLTNTFTVNGRIWAIGYTANNRQILITSPAGRSYQMGLDSQGRRTWLQNPGMALSSNTFDSRGRLTGIRYGEGAEARQFTLTYNAGYLGTITDPLGRNLQFFNDAVGRVTNMVRPDTQSVFFAYDAHGNRTALTPPGRAAHSFAYDTVDQISSYTAPAVSGVTNLITTHIYNADRQRRTTLRPDGKALTNLFNSAGQLTNQATDAGAYGFTWSNGLVRQISAPGGPTLNYGYNGFLVTTMRWSGVVTGQVLYAYNSDFFMRSLTINSTIITNGFDSDGLLTNAGICRLPRSAVNGLLTGIVLGSITQALSYNTFAELTNLAVNSAGGSNLFTETLLYDKLGRITSCVTIVQDTTNTFTYNYDAASRLIRVVTNGTGTNLYAYDPNGNRSNWVTSAGTFTATNDGQDRLIQWSGPAITSQYAYSQYGDLTNRVVNTTNVTTYSYDIDGNLRQVIILPGGITNDYIIDGLGRRVGKKVNGVFTNGWLYGNWLKPVAELDPGSNLVSVFIYGSRVNAPDYMVKTGVTYRIIADHLGSVRLVVREDTGFVAQRLDYDEWGRVVADSSPGFQPFGFAGGLYDADTGLVRFGVRDYDPQVGRWTRKDPLLFSGRDPNLYAYCRNSPVRYIDVTGLGPAVDEMLLRGDQGMDIIGTADYFTEAFPWAGPVGLVIDGGQFVNSMRNGDDLGVIHDAGMMGATIVSLIPGFAWVGPAATAVDYGSQAIFNAILNPGEGSYSATSGPISSGDATAAGQAQSGSTTTSQGQTIYY